MKVSYHDYLVGRMGIIDNGGLIAGIFFADGDADLKGGISGEISETALTRETNRQLQEYFAGERREFNLPIKAEGTAFQEAVWAEMVKIPFGETKSYKDLAVAVGKPKAGRAVGAACNQNPISLVVPCHRVVGSNGKLTGYAGGLDRKKFLLDLENLGVQNG